MTSLKLLNIRKVIKYVNDFKLEVNQVQEPKQAQKKSELRPVNWVPITKPDPIFKFKYYLQ